MHEQQITHQDIPVELLVEHHENSNFMKADMSRKLRRHIERTGRYEPLVVRPHPKEKGKYQVINGHNRLRVLQVLKHKTANCVVWNINDNETFNFRSFFVPRTLGSGGVIASRRGGLDSPVSAGSPLSGPSRRKWEYFSSALTSSSFGNCI